MRHDAAISARFTIAIEDLPTLDGEAALFDAALDASDTATATDHVIISLIINP